MDQIFKALLTDINKPPEAFPKSRNLSDRERNQLVNLCKKYKIGFNINKAWNGTASIRVGGMEFTQFETASKVIEALIKEKTYTYKPTYPMIAEPDLPF